MRCKLIYFGILAIMCVTLNGCQSTSDNRDYTPKGDNTIKDQMSSVQLMSYNMGMEDTKTYLETNNSMGPDEVFFNLDIRILNENIEVDPYAYFMGVAYYLILVDNDGNEYRDLDCGKWLGYEYDRRKANGEL